MANLSIGSQGEEVKKLQRALGITDDGIFGKQTAAAVEKYQRDNGLQVDGIAGKQTMDSLYKTAGATTPTTATDSATPLGIPAAPASQTAPSYGESIDLSQYKYDPATDAAYQQAQAALQQAKGGVPTYQATFDQQIQDLYDQIVNRDKFTWDMNGDVMYQQVVDQYAQLGNMAMQDTMGQAAAMTGGYGNSYAQTVSQQTYGNYMQQANDKAIEYYDRALAQYNQEGQNLKDQYAMLGDMRDTEFNRYQAALNNYWQNVNYQQHVADQAYNRGYTASRDAISDAMAEYDAGYQKFLDNWNMQNTLNQQAQEQSNWQQAFDYEKTQDDQTQKNWQAEFALKDQGQKYDMIADAIGSGANPDNFTDEQLAAAGMTRAGAEAMYDEWQDSETAESLKNQSAQAGIDATNASTKAQNAEYVINKIANGAKPTAEELNAAGLTEEDVLAIESAAAYSQANDGLQHVAALSSVEIVEALKGFNLEGDDAGLDAFLTDAYNCGRLTKEQALEYWEDFATNKLAFESSTAGDRLVSSGFNNRFSENAVK